MDPVSHLLTERERRPPPLVPFVVLAVGLHAGAAAGIWIANQNGSSLPAHLPSVSVRLIRPQEISRPSRPRSPARTADQPRPRTRPTAPPRREPPPQTQPRVEPQQRASENAMAAPEARATPAPPPPDAGGEPARGLSIAGGAAGMPGIPSDFQFTYYVERMLALIESRWYKPPVSGAPRARVRFTIARSGRVDTIRLEKSSGVPSFDRAALRALYAANPLPPLPPAYPKPMLTVHLTFSE